MARAHSRELSASWSTVFFRGTNYYEWPFSTMAKIREYTVFIPVGCFNLPDQVPDIHIATELVDSFNTSFNTSFNVEGINLCTYVLVYEYRAEWLVMKRNFIRSNTCFQCVFISKFSLLKYWVILSAPISVTPNLPKYFWSDCGGELQRKTVLHHWNNKSSRISLRLY